MGNILPYEYIGRQALREEKNKLLREINGKSIASPPLDPHAQHIVYTPGYFTPTKLYKTHPESHRDKQLFRRDKEALLDSQLKENQHARKKLETEISKIKSLIKISIKEWDQSSNEELEKVYSESLRDPGEDPEEAEEKEIEPSVSSLLGKFSGPKVYIKVWFCPLEHKPYELDCLIDLGCQLNMGKGNDIPSFLLGTDN